MPGMKAILIAVCATAFLTAGCASDGSKAGDTLSDFGHSAADGMKRLGGEIADGADTLADKIKD